MDLSVTNAWIAVGAVSLALIALAGIAALVFMVRAARTVSLSAERASVAIERMSSQLSPLASQTSAMLTDVHDFVQQVKSTTSATSAAVRQLGVVARPGLWPAFAAARGAAALVQWLAGRTSPDRDSVDKSAASRFDDEGGGQVRSGAGR